jgi:hypothetical protein
MAFLSGNPVPKVIRTEDFIHDELDGKCQTMIQMDVDRSIIGKKFTQEDKTLPDELKGMRSGTPIVIRYPMRSGAIHLSGSKRGIDEDQPDLATPSVVQEERQPGEIVPVAEEMGGLSIAP